VALSQSATSAALQELELGLNTKLFDRVGKRLILNENGQRLLPQAIRLLEAAVQIEEDFQRDEIVTRLRVGCSTTIGNYIMPTLLSQLHSHAPGVQIDLVMGNSAEIAQQAAQLSVDVGFIEGPSHLKDLIVHPWIEDELVIVAASTDPLSFQAIVTDKDLQEATWLLREAGSGTAEHVTQLLLPYIRQWSNTREIGSSESIKRMVAMGLGISCLSYWVAADLLESRKLILLNHSLPPLKRQLYQVYHRDKFISRGLRQFRTVAEALKTS
jgi:DNA-binding transcriptional LysR family regulator